MSSRNVAASLGLFLALGQASAQAPFTYYAPFRSNAPATGFGSGVNFANANAMAVGVGGSGAVLGSVSGTGITTANDDGIWANMGLSFFLVARTTDPAPGLSGVFFGDMNGRQPINNGPNLLFWSTLTGAVTTNDNEAYWIGPPNSPQVLVRKGDAVTGLTNVNYNLGNLPHRLNANNQVAFITNLVGSGVTGSTNQGIALGSTGNITLAVRRGDAAPGLTGVTMSSIDTGALTLNSNGDLAFSTGLSGTGITSANNAATWIKPNGQAPVLFARKGDAAPGAPGTTHNDLGDVRLNNNQFAAFRGTLSGGSVTGANDVGIWAGTAGSLQYVAREGDATVLPGITYNTINTHPVITPNNHVVFHSSLAGSVTAGTDAAFFYGLPGNVQVLAREGDAAPGTPFFFLSFDQLVHIRGDGSVVFVAQLANTPGGSNIGDSIWFGTPGNLQMILRQGDVIDLDPGPGVELLAAGAMSLLGGNPSGAADGYPRGGADDGGIGAEILFPGFEAAVVISPVPEPSSLLLAAAGVAAGWAVLRRRFAKLENPD